MRNIALIGYGYWGRNLARVLNELGVLAAIVDSLPRNADEARAAFPQAEVFTSIEQILAAPHIRAVCIATPAATHASLAIKAMERSKDVFVEKPMCLNVAEGQRMIAVAQERRAILMVGHLLLYHPAVIKLKSLIDTGELGKVLYVYSNRLNIGRIRTEENIFWSFAPHDVSAISHLLGEFPEAALAVGVDFLTPKLCDTTVSHLSYPSGVKAHIYVSWLHPFKEQKLVVVGERAMAVFSDTAPDKLLLYPHKIQWIGRAPVPTKADAQIVPLPHGEPLRLEIEHFLDCIATRKTPLSDGLNGLRVRQVLLGCDESIARDNVWQALTPKPEPGYYAHETAFVDDGAVIGKGTKIWHFCHVMKGAQLGEKCILGQNVFIANDVKIGQNVKIQNNVSVYTGTEVEDDVFLGPSCVLTNVTNPRSEVVRHSLYERTLLRKGCSIGANATIVCGSTVGRFAFVAAGAVVTKDAPDYALMVGVPARRKGWMSRHGVPLPPPGSGGIMTCPESGLRYQETAPGRLVCLDIAEDAPLPPEMRKGEKPYRTVKSSKNAE